MQRKKAYQDSVLGAVVVAKRKNARRITLRINKHNQAQVSVPSYVPFQTGLAFARKHGAWIADHRHDDSDIRLGCTYQLHDGMIVETQEATGRQSLQRNQSKLVIRMHPNEDGMRYFHRSINKHLAKQTEQVVGQRLPFWQERMGVSPQVIRYRATSTRWGSCSSKQVINFSAYAAQLPIALLDYVIVHELAHIRFMDHSQRFWATVEAQIDDYRSLRKGLKKFQLRPEIKKL